MPFILMRNDLTKVAADAIVCPSNEKLLQGSGTSRAIYLAAGEEKLEKACEGLSLKTGEAVSTSAFDLEAERIIHCAVPLWSEFKGAEYLKKTYESCLKLAEKEEMTSVAFPLLGAGNCGFPKKIAFRIAVDSINSFLLEKDMTVYLAVYDRESVDISRKVFSEIQEYISDSQVKERKHRAIRRRYTSISIDGAAGECSLENYLNMEGKSFSETLFSLIDERELKDSDVYRKANIDRRLFSKIRTKENYMPSKKTVLALIIALELDMDEAKKLLAAAGYAFTRSSKSDMIVSYFIEKKDYDIFKINEALFSYEQPLLGGF